MAEDHISELQDELLTDDELLEEFKQSPGAVLERHGISLTDEEQARLDARGFAGMANEDIRQTIRDDGLTAAW